MTRRKFFNNCARRREQHYTAAYSLALVYLGLGDHNEALNWLEQGYRSATALTSGQSVLIRSSLRFAAIRVSKRSLRRLFRRGNFARHSK